MPVAQEQRTLPGFEALASDRTRLDEDEVLRREIARVLADRYVKAVFANHARRPLAAIDRQLRRVEELARRIGLDG